MAAPMTTSHRHDGPDLIVTVEHDPRQSYSRAVDPRATRYARTVLPRWAAWALVEIDRDVEAPPGRAASSFRYAPATTTEEEN